MTKPFKLGNQRQSALEDTIAWHMFSISREYIHPACNVDA
jgi:hypothetical protein